MVVGSILEIPTRLIDIFEGQPRHEIDWEYIKGDLAPNIKRNGQREPGKVFKKGKRYGLIDGQHRFHSCEHNRMKFRATVERVDNDEQLFRLSVASNFGGREHTPLEIADAIAKMREFGDTWQTICDTFQKSLAWVMERHQLVNLSEPVKKMMGQDVPKANRLRSSVASEIAKLPKGQQANVAKSVRGMQKGRAVHEVGKAQVDAGIDKQYAGRQGRPSDQSRQLRSFLERGFDPIDMACDVEADTLEEMFAKAESFRHREMIEKIIKIGSRLAELQGKIEAAKLKGAEAVDNDTLELAIETALIQIRLSFQPNQVLLAKVYKKKAPTKFAKLVEKAEASLKLHGTFLKRLKRAKPDKM